MATLKPALEPPPGVTPNFVDPPSRSYITVIVVTLGLVLTTPLFLLRMYTRYYINRRLWWDDWATLFGWLGLFAFAGILIETIKYGNGTDMWNVTVKEAIHFNELFRAIEITARISMTFTKAAVLLMFLRIFVPPPTKKNKIYYSCWVIIWMNILYCIALVFSVGLQCVGKNAPPGATCINTYILVTSASSINSFSDLAMLIIPLVAIWHLHMPRKQKLAVSVVFAFGMLGLASALARLGWQLHEAKNQNRTVVLTTLVILAYTEHAIGLIVACMPVLPAFFRHVIRQKALTGASASGPDSRKTYGSGGLGYRRSGRPVKSGDNDTYLLSVDYQELEDIESKTTHGSGVKVSTNQGNDMASQPRTVDGVQINPHTDVIVSRSIQVESHCPDMITNASRPLPAHVRHER
ncbi:MAG: hypothetical protein M1815_003738 [Lichina confinis]|nr:MAG: hypothetical protein M1815_003738 [Lichina confinis]